MRWQIATIGKTTTTMTMIVMTRGTVTTTTDDDDDGDGYNDNDGDYFICTFTNMKVADKTRRSRHCNPQRTRVNHRISREETFLYHKEQTRYILVDCVTSRKTWSCLEKLDCFWVGFFFLMQSSKGRNYSTRKRNQIFTVTFLAEIWLFWRRKAKYFITCRLL